ncbi:MAG: T9SS type A sorting domain-containing protein, partial [Cytophagales bacterium]|nr:T9SS type A sorting domain-containing protein [Cytophagales bacterium]
AGDQADVKISLHPNPAAHTLYVALETAAPVEGTAVVDASGRTHLLNGYQTRDQNHLEVNVSTLEPGLYLLRLHTAQGLHVRRFLKQ